MTVTYLREYKPQLAVVEDKDRRGLFPLPAESSAAGPVGLFDAAPEVCQ